MRLADIIKFDLNGNEFYVYESDSGTETLVNGVSTPVSEFFKAIVESLGLAAPLLHNLLCDGPSCLEAREQDVDFNVNGVRFHCYKSALGSGKSVPHQYRFGTRDVTARQFNSRIREDLGRSLYLVRRALISLDRRFVETVRAA